MNKKKMVISIWIASFFIGICFSFAYYAWAYVRKDRIQVHPKEWRLYCELKENHTSICLWSLTIEFEKELPKGTAARFVVKNGNVMFGPDVPFADYLSGRKIEDGIWVGEGKVVFKVDSLEKILPEARKRICHIIQNSKAKFQIKVWSLDKKFLYSNVIEIKDLGFLPARYSVGYKDIGKKGILPSLCEVTDQ